MRFGISLGGRKGEDTKNFKAFHSDGEIDGLIIQMEGRSLRAQLSSGKDAEFGCGHRR